MGNAAQDLKSPAPVVVRDQLALPHARDPDSHPWPLNPQIPGDQKPNTPAERGLRLREAAQMKRAIADSESARDPTGARWDRRDAAEFDRRSEQLLTLPSKPAIGTGGELELSREEAGKKPGLACTVENPNLVTAEASRDRLELAGDAGCMTLAADAAETIRARNSLEKMLAHQLAAAHNLAMRLS